MIHDQEVEQGGYIPALEVQRDGCEAGGFGKGKGGEKKGQERKGILKQKKESEPERLSGK